MLKNKWFWIVGTLILINVATVTTIWLKSCSRDSCKNDFRGHDRGKFGGPGGMGDRIIKELELDETQKKDFEKIKNQHFEEIKKDFDSIQVFRKQIIEHLGQDEKSIAEIVAKIAAKESEITYKSFKHFNLIYSKCNEKQKEKLKELLNMWTQKRFMHKMHGPHDKGEQKGFHNNDSGHRMRPHHLDEEDGPPPPRD